MKLHEIIEIYSIISEGMKNIPLRNKSLRIRKSVLNQKGFKKVAFDTRRINQEEEYNPRRGLQNYYRSEKFISDVLSKKIENLVILRNVLSSLKLEYGKNPEWQDSNTRILLSTLDGGLRTLQKDGDIGENQPSLGSLDYIEELLHVRYRLGIDEISKMAEPDLKNKILSKDEPLIHKKIGNEIGFTKQDISNKNYGDLLGVLFGNIYASKENPEVERTITITVKDSIKGH